MSDLIDLKLSKKNREKSESVGLVSPKRAQYPYGLSLSLDNETLSKLDMKKLPKVGSKLTIEAIGVVTGISSNEREKGDEQRSVDIQLQKLCIEKGTGSVADAIEEGIDDADD